MNAQEKCPLLFTKPINRYGDTAPLNGKCVKCTTPGEYESCTTFMVACLSRSLPIQTPSGSDFQYK